MADLLSEINAGWQTCYYITSKISTGFGPLGRLAATMRAESVPAADVALVCDLTTRNVGPVAILLRLVPLGRLAVMDGARSVPVADCLALGASMMRSKSVLTAGCVLTLDLPLYRW